MSLAVSKVIMVSKYARGVSQGEPDIGGYLASRNRRRDAVIVTKCAHPNGYRNRVAPFENRPQ